RKLEFLVDKITHLPENFKENEFYADALFYRLQISIDATMDIIAMLCKDLGINVKDDYSNLDELEKLNIFSPDLIIELRRWNGLRNVIVHRYNKIEEELIFQEKDNVVKALKIFANDVEAIINEKIKISE
ncbi:MAG: type VII toxin-antitoxin system HepT family RNase toxin, partial [Promethearchaeota archaeon]